MTLGAEKVEIMHESENRRYYSIDFLKGIAMIMIVITHYSWSESQYLNLIFPFFIDMAVPILMFCTGFLWTIRVDEKLRVIRIWWVKKVMRFLIPFGISFVPDCYYAYKTGEAYSIFSSIKLFIVGGRGPGAYYVPVIIQIVFIFPIIHFAIKKYKEGGLILCFALNFFLEFIKNLFHLSAMTYRLLAFRYIFIIAAGCYHYLFGINKNEKTEMKEERIKEIYIRIVLLCMFIVGSLFIVMSLYTQWTPVILNYWTRTSCIACFYIIPIIVVLMKYNLRNNILEYIGKCSWGIFLVQKLYYKNLSSYIYEQVGSVSGRLLFGLSVCIILGILFDKITGFITSILVNKISTGSK